MVGAWFDRCYRRVKRLDWSVMRPSMIWLPTAAHERTSELAGGVTLVRPDFISRSVPRRVTIDAGHGGSEIGASYRFADGTLLQEKDVNLQVALQLGRMLQTDGIEVTYTRTNDMSVNAKRQDLNGDGKVSLAHELQARVDAADVAGSDVFVSVCFNGSSDPSVRGAET